MPRQARLDVPGTQHHVILRGTRAVGGRSRGPRKLPRGPRAVPRRHGAAARGLHVGNCEGGRESGATISPLSQQRPALRNYGDRGLPWYEAGVVSAGNGTAMRAAPVGLVHLGDPYRIYRDSLLQSVVTHQDSMPIA